MTITTLLVASLLTQTGYYRMPAVHEDTVVFASEGDLWVTSLEGGLARRLTTHAGEETHPTISADGAQLAFMGSYEGSPEVYTMPLAGGTVTRQTWGSERASTVGWTTGGDILFTSRHLSMLPSWQLIVLDTDLGTQNTIPLAEAADGAFAPDGRLYFVRYQFQGSHTKRYKGGTARDIWMFAPGAEEAQRLTGDFPGEDIAPMWWNDRVYFASERSGSMNLWSMAPDGSEVRQHTEHTGFDVRDPAMGQGVIVYQLGADLWSFEIETGVNRRIPIELASDRDQLRERWIDEPFEWLTAAHLDHAGERVVLTARGDVFVAPVESGRIARLMHDREGRFRNAAFVAETDEILALADVTGELDFWSMQADGYGDPVRVTNDARNHRESAIIGPKGRYIAWRDTDFGLWLHDRESQSSSRIDEGLIDVIGGLVFSPDGRFLAYTRAARNQMSQIWFYDIESGRRTAMTTDRVSSASPAFSPDGEWLYYLGDRHFETVVQSPWGLFYPQPFLAHRTTVNAMPLTGAKKSPFAADDEIDRFASRDDADEEDAPGDGADDEEDDSDDDASDEAPALAYDLQSLAARTVHVPIPPGRYGDLAIAADHVYLLEYDVLDPGGRPTLVSFKIDDEVERTVVAKDIGDYELSPDRKKVLIRTRRALAVGKANGSAVDMGKEAVKLAGWQFPLDPQREFRQMFHEAWRMERDYFYDPNMHGVDWNEVRERHLPLVDRVATRSELSDLISQVVGELSALHIYVGGGEFREGDDQVGAASLGARLLRDEAAGGYRIVRRYRSDPDFPAERGPLSRPDHGIRDGDVLTHIDGVPLLSVAGPGALLRGKAGQPVRLRIVSGDDEPRDVIVDAISTRREADLRYDDWERTRREMVDAWSDRKVGYVHVRAMGEQNYAEDWIRNLFPVHDRQGLIVDVRHNRGGNIDSWLLGQLMRQAWMYWQGRAGAGTWNMQNAFRGHIVVLCDAWTASDGEAFCDGFRRLGLGSVIGTRTWGGEIWLSFQNRLVDGGIASAAEYGVYGPEGAWLIEGHGFEPDIVVDNLPHATYNGTDAQLRAAVTHLQSLIETEPRPVPPAPAYPDKSK